MSAVEAENKRAVNTKAQILDNARELFATHGYDGTSIRQLTASLNITPAALYYHFASKNDVLEGLAKKLHDGSDALLQRIREFDQSAESMREALCQYYDLLADDIHVFRLVYNDAAIQHSPIGQRLRGQARDFYAYLVGPEPSVEDRMRAAGAVGIIRLSLEQRGVDPAKYRDVVVERAVRVMTDI
ncbi:MAG: helix-turn-helix domain-containing protein [Actinomycetota bacterium]|nr:helix-turn-helix domain-containing protein [Actinomycetota bacterium]MEC9058524.1 helix-turn-helix domain-containing protein [Actinomycetota bacterium]